MPPSLTCLGLSGTTTAAAASSRLVRTPYAAAGSTRRLVGAPYAVPGTLQRRSYAISRTGEH
eukprot:622347-Rhodomonas_salina.7